MRGEYSTKQRSAIVDFLKESSSHVTASDILFHLKEKGIKIGTATVYRTLEKLESEGVVKKMQIENSFSACYQYMDSHDCAEHFHLKCVRCGALIHLSCEFLTNLEEHIFNEHSFTISSGKTVIYGTCSKCELGDKATDKKCSHCNFCSNK